MEYNDTMRRIAQNDDALRVIVTPTEGIPSSETCLEGLQRMADDSLRHNMARVAFGFEGIASPTEGDK